jgi:hypothetical protein
MLAISSAVEEPDTKLTDIDITNPSPANLRSLAGLLFFASDLIVAGVDRYPSLKVGVGLLAFTGGCALSLSGIDTKIQTEMAVAGVPPILTGLALIFEKAANRLSDGISPRSKTGLRNKAANTAKFCLKYPVALAVLSNMVTAASALAAGVKDPSARHLVICGGLLMIGITSFAATDEGVKELTKGVTEETLTPEEFTP